MSKGKIIPKYKIRLIKTKYIDPEGAKKGDWHAFSAEWTPNSRTHVGHFVKKFYLDELPQFYRILTPMNGVNKFTKIFLARKTQEIFSNLLIGDMSFVGPRPLAVHHYERDLKQGNVTRYLLKGGLLVS